MLLDISHEEFYSYDRHDECHYHTDCQQDSFFRCEYESEFGKFEKAGSEHYRNSQEPGMVIDEAVIKKIEERYRDILKIAKDEYEYEPPTKYYMDGYNLYKRMEKYMSNHLLFLYNPNVPTTNNEAERLLRAYKRKQAQAVSFRSPDSIDYLCRCMSMLFEMRKNSEKNIFQELSNIFA